MLAAPSFPNPWAFEANPEVYLLVAFLIGAYVYMVRVIGPTAVRRGEPVVTRRHLWCFGAAMVMLFTASTWPIHQISENYLYSAHMLQHMMLSYFLPPLVLLATPEWMFRILIGAGRVYRAVRFMARPVVAGLVFNTVVIITHVPGVVNASTTNGALHYALHFLVVMAALLMWMPVVGPFDELHMTYGGKMIYLFLQSVVPTIPAGWLTFAEGAVYKHYNQPVRVWGLSVTSDQQLAGAIMKLGGGVFLWTVVIFLFFRRFSIEPADANSYRRVEAPLTYESVAEVFERTPPPVEQDL